VIIGVGQYVDRDADSDHEPTALMLEAVRAAALDTGAADVLGATQLIAVVPVVSWRYRDPGAVLAEALGITASTWYPTVGGNTPQMLVNRLACAIAQGEVDLGIVTGGEAYRTRITARKAGDTLDWTKQDEGVAPDWSDGGPMSIGHPAELARGIVLPTQAYPLFENAIWHASGRTKADHLALVGEMWAGFSRVAAANPNAWRHDSFTAAEITTPTPDNRLVGSPYTKRMVSNPDVNMATGMIMCSIERARALGVTSDRWVFPHSGTDGHDFLMSERPDFTSSPAIAVAGNRALELAGVSIDDVAHLDLYSCFPSAVQIAAKELAVPINQPLPIDQPLARPLTVYGGLGFAGGPWNNPVGHALATMVEVLRNDPGSVALVTANGGNVEKHAFGVYSTDPLPGGFRHEEPQGEIDGLGRVSVLESYEGPARIEAWTVMHERDGSPVRAHAACRTPSGERVWGVTSDGDHMTRAIDEDLVGVGAIIGTDGGMTFD